MYVYQLQVKKQQCNILNVYQLQVKTGQLQQGTLEVHGKQPDRRAHMSCDAGVENWYPEVPMAEYFQFVLFTVSYAPRRPCGNLARPMF
jgi:hypothetical protein